MKFILEFNSFIDKIELAYSETRSKPLTEDEFIEIFNTNCKNFSFDNTQLYRGVILDKSSNFFYINPLNSSDRGHSAYSAEYIKKTDYNIKLTEDPQFKDLPSRHKCLIGSTNIHAAMITVGSSLQNVEDDKMFIIIPFDNIEIAVAPVLDLIGFENKIRPLKDMKRSDFKLLRYTNNFNIKHESSQISGGKEIWTSGRCLLVRYTELEKLKKLIEQRS